MLGGVLQRKRARRCRAQAPPPTRRPAAREPARRAGRGPWGGARGACAERRLLSRGRTPSSHLSDKHHENSAAHTVIAAPAAGRASTPPSRGARARARARSPSAPAPPRRPSRRQQPPGRAGVGRRSSFGVAAPPVPRPGSALGPAAPTGRGSARVHRARPGSQPIGAGRVELCCCQARGALVAVVRGRRSDGCVSDPSAAEPSHSGGRTLLRRRRGPALRKSYA